MKPPPVAICYIIDVGMQAGGHSGSSNAITYPGGRGRKSQHAIVIDCGDRPQTMISLLQVQKITRIDHVFLSHNDRDHAGGILDLINAFHHRVGKVWMLQDRPAGDIRYFPELDRLEKARAIEAIKWIQRDDKQPYRLYPEENASPEVDSPWSIHLLYPLAVTDVMNPQIKGDPNTASAVLLLQAGEGDHRGRILFPGDARVETLRGAKKHFSGSGQQSRPIRCDVLIAPHHGGAVQRGSRLTREQYETLFREVVQSQFAVVSVATNNRDGHPHEEHIVALSSACDSVLCTQITSQCCGDVQSHYPSVLRPVRGVPRAPDPPNNDRGVACAGTVVVDIGPFPLEPRRWKDHRWEVDQLHRRNASESREAPLCRRHVGQPVKTELSVVPSTEVPPS
jgi:beta-lactamase superfamily II metal-dependent hydrolase